MSFARVQELHLILYNDSSDRVAVVTLVTVVTVVTEMTIVTLALVGKVVTVGKR